MQESKPIVIFTTFWDAEDILKQKCFLFQNDNKTNIVYVCTDSNNKPENFCVYSIALAHPSLDKIPNIKEQTLPFFIRLDMLCPTYDILMKYKRDKDWVDYTKKYKQIISKRKDEIKNWIFSLRNNFIYILCCWENTKSGANCHRQILYNAIIASKTLKDKATYIYRHGKESFPNSSKAGLSGFESEISLPQNGEN